MKFDKLINQFCLENAKTVEDNINLKYYTVLEVIKPDNVNYNLNLCTGIVEFITNSDGWLEKFSIVVGHFGVKGLLVLVSDDCPQVYIEEPSDILNLVEAYISESTVSELKNFKTFINNTTVLTTNDINNNLDSIYKSGTLIHDSSTGSLWLSNYDGKLTSISSSNVTYTAASSCEPETVSIKLD